MIAHLRGKLISRHPNEVIVETMGVGYDVTISVPTFSELPPAGTSEVHVIPSWSATQEDVLSALMNLGYQKAAAEKALGAVEKNAPFDAMFRAALAVMAK